MGVRRVRAVERDAGPVRDRRVWPGSCETRRRRVRAAIVWRRAGGRRLHGAPRPRGRLRWRAPERDDTEIGERAAARECLTALLWAASLRGTPPGPAFDAEVGSFARVARLGPHRHSQRPAPLKAVVRSPRGLVLFRAPSDYAAAFGVTWPRAAEHFLQLQGAAPRTTSSSRRALRCGRPSPTRARARVGFNDALPGHAPRARLHGGSQKAAGAPWPWSGDDVLNRHKFTNVKREHDRVTAWLRAHWTSAHSDADAATVLFNCGVFRTFGTVAFAEALGWTHSLKDWDAGKARAAAVACWRGGRHAFTRAYCRPRFNAERRRGDAGARPPVDVYDGAIRILAALRGECHNVMDRGGSWRAVCTRLRRVAGFGGGGFMAKEVLHDAMGWASVRALVRDAGDWTPPGPGARRGLNRYHGRALWGSPGAGRLAGEARFIKEMGLLLGALRDSDRVLQFVGTRHPRRAVPALRVRQVLPRRGRRTRPRPAVPAVRGALRRRGRAAGPRAPPIVGGVARAPARAASVADGRGRDVPRRRRRRRPSLRATATCPWKCATRRIFYPYRTHTQRRLRS